MPAEANTAPILSIWSRTDAERESTALGLSARRLQANADLYLVEAKQEQLSAQASLDAAYQASKGSPDFGALVEARIRVATAELTLTKGAEVYTELFGTAPVV